MTRIPPMKDEISETFSRHHGAGCYPPRMNAASFTKARTHGASR